MSGGSENQKDNIVRPGGLIAILGGGQLGRMTAMTARTMGYRVRVMDPEAKCPASFIADETIVGRWDDVDAARRLAAGADVVTLEIEQIGVDALREVAQLAPLRPGVEPVRIIQDKTLQKVWLAENGFPVGPFRVVRSEAELMAAVDALGGDIFLKTGRGGYDGRGQARLGESKAMQTPVPEGEGPGAPATAAQGPESRPGAPATAAQGSESRQGAPNSLNEALKLLAAGPCVAEKALELECEISVMAARSPSGEVKVFPAARNHHENQILAWSVLPAGVSGELEARAEQMAADLVAKLGIEGLLCAEVFVTRQGGLFVNEMAPRPHNSYHESERGCVTSQFEQLVRAVCNLPLGATEIVSPAAIVNLLGDVWIGGEPDFAAALAVPGVRLHLYEKLEPRAGRKMGHLSATGKTAEEALERVLEAKGRL